MNRCSVCDYTEEDGSFLTNREPSHQNKVRPYHHPLHGTDTVCDDCMSEIEENLAELSEADVEVEGS